MSKKRLQKLSISGYKSIRELNDFEIRPLNVLIGANGAGKSNLISFFRLLNAIFQQRLQVYSAQKGGAEKLLYYGSKTTGHIKVELRFDSDLSNIENGFEFKLVPADDNRVIFEYDTMLIYNSEDGSQEYAQLGDGHFESIATNTHVFPNAKSKSAQWYIAIREVLGNLLVYHFHDTSDTAYMKNQQDLHDNRYLKSDGTNIAPYLYYLKQIHPDYYQRIVKTIQRVAPFFDDFVLEPMQLDREMIRFEWRDKNSLDMTFSAHDLSDGTLRFICLATLLMQPELPSLIVIDEPELGLHPFAKNLLAGLLRSASTKTQIIIATQSAGFVSQFVPEDVIVVSRQDGKSTFERLDSSALEEWMQEYSLGELWEKNVIGGRPQRESI